MKYVIDLLWDEEAKVWLATSDEVFGLVLESENLSNLVERVKNAFSDLTTIGERSSDYQVCYNIHKKYRVEIYHEDDGSVTAASQDMDLADNGSDIETALDMLAESILDYASEYMKETDLYERDSRRRGHRPFLEAALMLGSPKAIKELMVYCEKSFNGYGSQDPEESSHTSFNLNSDPSTYFETQGHRSDKK